eukprot:6207144-Pleurochrysis_carterae.AAC.2
MPLPCRNGRHGVVVVSLDIHALCFDNIEQCAISNTRAALARALPLRAQLRAFLPSRASSFMILYFLPTRQEEIVDMKRKFKIMNHQIEQLKEEIHSKDTALVKEHFDHIKVWLRARPQSGLPTQLETSFSFCSASRECQHG